MDTITLCLTITYFVLMSSGEGTCRTKTFYFDNHNDFFCVLDVEKIDSKGTVTHTQELYVWDSLMLILKDGSESWDTLPVNNIEYTVDKLDLGMDVTTKFEQAPSPGDVEGTMTFVKESSKVISKNLMNLDCPTPLIIIDKFTLKLLPDIDDYNVTALKQSGALRTWKTENGNFPVFWTSSTSTSLSVVDSELYTSKREYRESSSILYSKESISDIKAQYAHK